MTHSPTFRFVVALAALSPGAAVVGQSGPGSAGPAWQRQPPAVQRADEGIGDVDPLGLSLREMQVDLRSPAGFDSVFRLDRTDAFGRRETLFMRMDGGTTAVFPQSIYGEDVWGQFPVIPPGTTFYIGRLPAELQGVDAARPRPVTMLDLTYRAVAEPAGPAARQSPDFIREASPRPVRSVWTDSGYREERIAAMLAGAADAAEAPSRER
jgi:hypothetical protein